MITEKQSYSEVYAFLNALGSEYINKIPKKVYITIEKNRDISYNPSFNKNQTIDKTQISEKATAIIAALNLQYWCIDNKEKERLIDIYQKNAEIKREKYSYDNLFKPIEKENQANDKKEDITYESNQSNNFMIEIPKENIIQIIINKIKSVFKK